MDPSAPERRGWTGRDLSGDGQRTGGDGVAGLPADDPRARQRQARAAEAAGASEHEHLLPALRIAGVGYRAGCLALQEDGQRARRRSSARGARVAATAAAARGARRLARAAPAVCAAAAGHFNSPTAITRISMTPRRSPGRCTGATRARATRRDRPRARLAGRHAEQATAASPHSMSTTPATTSTTSRSPTMARCSIRRPRMSPDAW